jgi:hypothetical protein
VRRLGDRRPLLFPGDLAMSGTRVAIRKRRITTRDPPEGSRRFPSTNPN